MADNNLAPRSKNKLPWYEQALPMEGRATFLPYQDTLPGSVMNQRSFALPGVVAGAVNAFTAPGRAYSGSDQSFDPAAEAANFAMTTMGGGMGASRLAPAPRNALGMNVYQGSPHRFPPTAKNPLGEFDASKIGTGEGAQAYGRGHYSAEAKDVASGYRGNLSSSDVILDGKNIGPVAQLLQGPAQAGNSGTVIPGVRGSAKNPALSNLSQAEQEAIGFVSNEKTLDDAVAKLREQASQTWRSADARKIWEQRANTLDGLRNRVQVQEGGSLYTIDLPDEHIAKMLDWDKPLSQQPQAFKDAVSARERQRMMPILEQRRKTLAGLPEGAENASILKKQIAILEDEITQPQAVPNMTGGEYFNYLRNRGMAPAAQADWLKQAGVPGIRYLDQGSRGVGQGTSNFVVFPGNEDMMRIINRE